MKLDIVIVNWNSGCDLKSCLMTIEQSEGIYDLLGDVIVVDNASTDGSADGLLSTSLPIRVVYNRHNRGFAAACNQGASQGKSEYILFLNPDTTLPPDTLYKSAEYLSEDANDSIGILGVQLVDDAGNISRSCSRFPSALRMILNMLGLDRLLPNLVHGQFMRYWGHDETRDVDQVIGAYFFTRRFLYTLLGGFDERFFVYFEEVDYCLRARHNGWGCRFFSSVRARHSGCGSSRHVPAKRLYYILKSRIQFSFKHFSAFQASAVLACTLLVEPFSRALYALLRRTPGDVRETARAYMMLVRDFFNAPMVLRNGGTRD